MRWTMYLSLIHISGADIDNFFLAEIYNAHAVLLFTDSYGKTYAKMLLQLT